MRYWWNRYWDIDDSVLSLSYWVLEDQMLSWASLSTVRFKIMLLLHRTAAVSPASSTVRPCQPAETWKGNLPRLHGKIHMWEAPGWTEVSGQSSAPQMLTLCNASIAHKKRKNQIKTKIKQKDQINFCISWLVTHSACSTIRLVTQPQGRTLHAVDGLPMWIYHAQGKVPKQSGLVFHHILIVQQGAIHKAWDKSIYLVNCRQGW